MWRVLASAQSSAGTDGGFGAAAGQGFFVCIICIVLLVDRKYIVLYALCIKNCILKCII